MLDEENFFSQNLYIFCEMFTLLIYGKFAFFTKQIKAIFCKNKQIFLHFLRSNIMLKYAKYSGKNYFLEKCKIFAKRFSLFALNPTFDW